MGQIYVVRHRLLDRLFALKVLHPHLASDRRLADRLRIEAQAMARLAHPNVAKVTDFWTAEDGSPSFIMELLSGENLADHLLERQRLSANEVVAIGCQCMAALVAAHEIGIVHRDIKPENLFMHQPASGEAVLKVLDFGVARVVADCSALTPDRLVKSTRTGIRIGSPRFMSPEGLKGDRVDHRADIYSVGLTLYVCLVGNLVFDATHEKALTPPSKTADIEPHRELDRIILKAIQCDPDARYQEASEFLNDLNRLRSVRRNQSMWQIRRIP
jgi:serine/threonine-protein kinase